MGASFEPPVHYLRDCSDTSLRCFELNKLEHVANLRRELRVLWEEMLEESALAHLARWMIENRAELRSAAHSMEQSPATMGEPPLAALGEPPGAAAPPAMAHGAAPGPVLMEAAKRSSGAQEPDSRRSVT